MECWITNPCPEALDWMSVTALGLDSRMVLAAVQTSHAGVWIWVGCVFVWIFTSLCFLADASNALLRYSLDEEVPQGTLVGDVLQDSHLTREFGSKVIQQFRFRFLDPPKWNISIEEQSGKLRTSGRLDREAFVECVNNDLCTLTVDVVIQPVEFFRAIKVIVEINDINDNAPTFSERTITHPILESTEPGSSFMIPTATDPDSPVFSVLRYELESHRKTFSIHVHKKLDGSLDVQLTIDRRLDRERRHHYKVKVVAYDGGEPAKVGRLEVSIPILDSNDNSPVFQQSLYEVSIAENLPSGTTILRVQATDKDEGQNSKIQYHFSLQTQTLYGKMLTINSNTGQIIVIGQVDREKMPVCNLVVTARDSGPNGIPSDTTVVITVEDANDNAPNIKVSTLGTLHDEVAAIKEDAEIGTFVAHVIASDPDAGPNGVINCTLNDYTFELKPIFEGGEYQIVTSRTLDRENIPQYGLRLVCRDHGQPPRRSEKRLTVDVLDVNDNTPRFTQKSYTTAVLENNYVGKGILQTYARDKDQGQNSRIKYSLSEEVRGVFDIDPESGGIKAVTRIDREQNQRYEFHVIATDCGEPPLTSYALVVINIDDVDDSIPEFVFPKFTFSVTENQPVGSEVGEVTAADEDIPPNNEFFYSFADERASRAFHLNSKTGQIMSQSSLDREKKAEYKLVVKATDKKTPAMSSTAIVNINIQDENDNSPSFLFPTNRNNTVNISSKVPKGVPLVSILAHDPDEGENARLTYTVLSGNEDGLFYLNRDSGILTSTTYLSDMNLARFSLNITVRDNGFPSYEVRQVLKIFIDSKIPYPPPKSEPSSIPGKTPRHYYVIVIVAVACGATVIVVSCIICVILIRKSKQRRNSNCSGKAAVNGPMESHRMLTPKDSLGSTDDQIAMKDIDGVDISESMRKLLAANSANDCWDKSPTDIMMDHQGSVGLEITKVLSEMDDDTTELPELLSHTTRRGRSPVPGENGGVVNGGSSHPSLMGTPSNDHEEGDSDTTAEFNMGTGPSGSQGSRESIRTLPTTKPSTMKGKVSFSHDDKTDAPRKVYHYPPPPPPPPNRLRTFSPDGRLPDSPQRSCLVSDSTTLPRRSPKVVTWQPSPDLSGESRNYENANFDRSRYEAAPYTSEMDPWEQREATITTDTAKGESMIV